MISSCTERKPRKENLAKRWETCHCKWKRTEPRHGRYAKTEQNRAIKTVPHAKPAGAHLFAHDAPCCDGKAATGVLPSTTTPQAQAGERLLQVRIRGMDCSEEVTVVRHAVEPLTKQITRRFPIWQPTRA